MAEKTGRLFRGTGKTNRLAHVSDEASQRALEEFQRQLAAKKPEIIKKINEEGKEYAKILKEKAEKEKQNKEKHKGEKTVEAVENCRPDAVIVVVYPNQKITVPFSIIEGMGENSYPKLKRLIAVNLLKNHKFGVEEHSSIKRQEGYYKITGLGHAGVCAIDGKEEKAYYFEFGRYGGDNNGRVRKPDNFKKPVSVKFEGDNPTMDSLKALCQHLKETNYSKGVNFEGIYVKIPCNSAQDIKKRAEAEMPNHRGAYDLTNNHCMTFAIDMAKVAGVDVSSAEKTEGLEVTETDRVMVEKEIMNFDFGPLAGTYTRIFEWKSLDEKKRENIDGVVKLLEDNISKMVPPSKMIHALQEIWNKLNYAPIVFEGFQDNVLQKKT